MDEDSFTAPAERLRQQLLSSNGYSTDPESGVQLLTGHRILARDWWAICQALFQEEQLPGWEERSAVLHHPDQFTPMRMQHDVLMRLHDRILRFEPGFRLSASQIHATMAAFLKITHQGFKVSHGLFSRPPKSD